MRGTRSTKAAKLTGYAKYIRARTKGPETPPDEVGHPSLGSGLDVAEQLLHLEALAFVARPVLSDHYKANCCIAATKAAIAICKSWGIPASPLLVEMQVASPTRILRIDSNPIPGRTGLWGHLVARVDTGGVSYIVDLSAYQLDRPEHGIRIPSGLLLPLPESPDGSVLVRARNGVAVLTYSRHARPSSTPWVHLPDWSLETPRHRLAHERVVRGLLDAVASARGLVAMASGR